MTQYFDAIQHQLHSGAGLQTTPESVVTSSAAVILRATAHGDMLGHEPTSAGICAMKDYGQFCPLALASEIVGERWTPLVLRELMMGGRRFNDIHNGVPRMSPSLLSKRLRTLRTAGVLECHQVATHTEYRLTPAGEELLPVIEYLAVWGKRWLPATLSENNADPDLVMWDHWGVGHSALDSYPS